MTKATGSNTGIYEYIKIDMFGKTFITHNYHATSQSLAGTGGTEYCFINNQESQSWEAFDTIGLYFSGNTTQAAGSVIQIYTKE